MNRKAHREGAHPLLPILYPENKRVPDIKSKNTFTSGKSSMKRNRCKKRLN